MMCNVMSKMGSSSIDVPALFIRKGQKIMAKSMQTPKYYTSVTEHDLKHSSAAITCWLIRSQGAEYNVCAGQ